MAGGLGIGLASILSPMYIAEVAPAELRGKLVASNQLAIVIGIVLAQVMNWLIGKPLAPNATWMQIRQSWDGQLGWRWMFAVTAIPASLFIVAMFFAPESPRWLARKGLRARSERILSNIGGEAYSARVFAEIEETLTHGAPEPGLRELLKRRYARPLLLGIGLAVLQQWCGINVIFNYAQEVFTAAGYNLSSMLFNIMVTGFVTLIFTVAAIATVDRPGSTRAYACGMRRIGRSVCWRRIRLLFPCARICHSAPGRGCDRLLFHDPCAGDLGASF